MSSISKHQRIRNYMERKHRKLVEEAYNLQYTDHERSDVLTFEALQLDQKLKFLHL
ncbi:Lacal_2735 family protein [Dokdonia sp. Hel_I_53]|uniref:Lacal_2735 family protein n=1 Tax=Dokdonia sp. Hel_I_53 TaxID=1566287 RepID=UPI00119A6BFE|nr:Lacal_2735 family protein [Dokdonia sp. Hel_I_53]TVZ51721.1 hypothetical protein OD90_0873 [Dokdonia sp. Hel_I_53]